MTSRAVTAFAEYDGILEGFLRGQLFFSAVEAELFSVLDEPRDAEEVARFTGWRVSAVESILEALSVQGWIERVEGHPGGRWGNGTEARRFLSRHSDESMAELLSFQRRMMGLDGLAGLASAEERPGCGPCDFAAMARAKSVELRLFRQRPCVDEARRLFDADAPLSVLDCGGGSGLLALALAGAFPRCRATVFETPAVAPVARQFVEREGMEDRVRVRSGDFLVDPLGGPWDLIVASGILEFAGDGLDAFLRKLRDSLALGGKMMVYSTAFGEGGLGRGALRWLSGCLRAGRAIRRHCGDLMAALNEAGFETIRSTDDGLYPLRIFERRE